MAGRVLTEEDFPKGDTPAEDTTSKPEEKVETPVEEVPEGKETPRDEDGDKESLPKPSDETPKYKHKTWDETEKARIELEKEFTKKSMRISEVEKELAQFKKPPEKPAPTVDDHIAEIADEALKNIGSLTADSPSRDRDAAIIWAKAQRKISRLEIDETNKQANTERETVSKTYERAQKEGIKNDSELRILGYEYSRTDSSLNTDERIDKAIESTKGIISHIREGFVKDQERDKKEKDDLKVLGRGSSRREEKETKETRPATMSEQLAQINEKRRVTRNDLR